MKLKNIALSCLLCVIAITVRAQVDTLVEAEKAILSGSAEIVTCSNASGGEMVKGLGGGSANSVRIQNIDIPSAGRYFVTLSYYSINERELTYALNADSETTIDVPATGDWCYQGGSPGDFIFEADLIEGKNELLFYDAPILDKVRIRSDTTARAAQTFYVSDVSGNDSNSGLSKDKAWQSIARVNTLEILPGDSILFKSNETFKGRLYLSSEGGNNENGVFIGSYGEGQKPVIDGDGNLSALHILNSSYIHIENLELKNDNPVSKPGTSEDLRYGLYLQNGFSDGTVFKHYRFCNLTIREIYPTTQISDNDQTGVNAHAIITSGSWGDDINPIRFDDVKIENCFFTRTGRHAVVVKAINDLEIRNNLFEHVGGAGMVIGNGCANILVERNITDHTGSSIDTRMAGRGSGLWCFRSKNLTVQHNHFMYARGIKDSYGMHIDIGNRNVVYQYNYSVNNEGGFVEILGMNVNVGYRYNLSIADGWRKRGNQTGNVFWVAGWSGDPQNPIGSDSVFIYNNSVYVPDTIAPGILFETVTQNTRIYNNIVNVNNQFGPVRIKNESSYNDFDYNIWFGNIPDMDEDGESYWGANALTADPLYKDATVTDSMGFLLQSGSPAIGSGKLIYDASVSRAFDGYDNNGGRDYFGEAVSNTNVPNRGADNSDALTGIFHGLHPDDALNVYPNPVGKGQKLTVDLPNDFEIFSCEVIDLSGRVHYNKKDLSGKNIEIGTNAMQSGLYFVKVRSENKMFSKPFIVQ